MNENLSRHPSDIAESALKYLDALEASNETRAKHEEVLFFFVESLCSDSSAVVESPQGEYLLCSGWDDYYGGVISVFVDWWLPRKVLNDRVQSNAPDVLRKWLKWCFRNDYFDESKYRDFQEALPRGKTSQIKRLQRAARLLHRLHTPNPGAWMTDDPDKVVSIGSNRAPEEFDEGYMQVVRLGESSAFVKNDEGTEYGPVLLGDRLVEVLEVGDIVNISVGKFGDSWNVLESGNVYAKDTGIL